MSVYRNWRTKHESSAWTEENASRGMGGEGGRNRGRDSSGYKDSVFYNKYRDGAALLTTL